MSRNVGDPFGTQVQPALPPPSEGLVFVALTGAQPDGSAGANLQYSVDGMTWLNAKVDFTEGPYVIAVNGTLQYGNGMWGCVLQHEVDFFAANYPAGLLHMTDTIIGTTSGAPSVQTLNEIKTGTPSVYPFFIAPQPNGGVPLVWHGLQVPGGSVGIWNGNTGDPASPQDGNPTPNPPEPFTVTWTQDWANNFVIYARAHLATADFAGGVSFLGEYREGPDFNSPQWSPTAEYILHQVRQQSTILGVIFTTDWSSDGVGSVAFLSYDGVHWFPQPISDQQESVSLDWEEDNNRWTITSISTGEVSHVSNPNPSGTFQATDLVDDLNPAEDFDQTGGVNVLPEDTPLPGALTATRQGFDGGAFQYTMTPITPTIVDSGDGWPAASWISTTLSLQTSRDSIWFGQHGAGP